MARIVKPKYAAKFPLSAEREYQKLMRGFVREMAAAVIQNQKQIATLIQKYRIKLDADLSDLSDTGLDMAVENLMTSIAEQYAYKVSKRIIRDKVLQVFQRVNRLNNVEFRKTLKSALGVDIFQAEPWLNQHSDVWVRENVRLIKSVQTQYFDRIEAMVLQTVKDGDMTVELAAKIKEIGGVSERRANVIARDQVGKLNGQLTKYRQMNVGIDKYEWSTAGDRRVRPAHRNRSGKTYRWDSPPPDGHPGEAVLCRCSAVPIIDLDEIQYRKSL